jgi:hypothetical protein
MDYLNLLYACILNVHQYKEEYEEWGDTLVSLVLMEFEVIQPPNVMYATKKPPKCWSKATSIKKALADNKRIADNAYNTYNVLVTDANSDSNSYIQVKHLMDPRWHIVICKHIVPSGIEQSLIVDSFDFPQLTDIKIFTLCNDPNITSYSKKRAQRFCSLNTIPNLVDTLRNGFPKGSLASTDTINRYVAIRYANKMQMMQVLELASKVRKRLTQVFSLRHDILSFNKDEYTYYTDNSMYNISDIDSVIQDIIAHDYNNDIQ